MHLSDEDLDMLALLALRRGEVLEDDASHSLVENGYATWDGPLLILTAPGEATVAALLTAV